MRDFQKIPFGCVAIGLLLVIGNWGLSSGVLANVASARVAQSDVGTSLVVLVRDTDLVPITGARVTLMNWTGRWEPSQWNGVTDDNGAIAFDNVILDFGVAVVSHPDFATVEHALSMEANTNLAVTEPRRLNVKMAPAVQSHLQLVGPDNLPVVGAEIGFLSVTHPELDLSMTLTSEDLPRLGDGSFRSDENGRLALPPLPRGSVVELQASHEKFAPVAIRDFRISSDPTPTLQMKLGVQLEIELAGEAVEAGELENTSIYMRLFPEGMGLGIENRIMQSLPVVDGRFRIGVPSLRYSSFILQGDNLFITPRFDSGRDPLPELDLTTKGDQATWRIKVRRTHPVRGRVVDMDGTPVANVELFLESANEVYNEDTGHWQPHADRPWTSVDYVVTNNEGYFQSRIPSGKTKIEVNRGPCFLMNDEGFQFDYSGPDSLPDIQVCRLPVIQLTVQDQQQKPVPRSVIRILGNIETDYDCAANDGRVEVSLTQRPLDEKHEHPSHFVDLLAFDPYSNLAGTCRLDLLDQDSFQNAILTVEPHDLEWPHRMLQARDTRFIRSQSNQTTNDPIITEFPLAVVGTEVGPMNEGIWMDTPARSLTEFHGQFVLLDFWFIGCGPCLQELPHIRLLHELYREHGGTVVSVHISGVGAEQVQQFAKAHDMKYPLVVDPPEQPISAAYRNHAVNSYPTYILLDQHGRIASHSSFSVEPNLRMFPIESMRLKLLQAKQK